MHADERNQWTHRRGEGMCWGVGAAGERSMGEKEISVILKKRKGGVRPAGLRCGRKPHGV